MVERIGITVEEFERFVELPENEDRRFELIDGEIVEMSPTELHNLVGGNFYRTVYNYVDANKLGRVVYETYYRSPDDNRNVRVPDIAFTRAERLLPVVERGSIPQMPDLAIEIKSPNDTYAKMRATAAYYLSKGVQLVWLVYPKKRVIEVFRPGMDSEILTAEDMLDGGDVLPGFRVPVQQLFEIQ
jgi:Uma2 family endonuclease